MANSMPSLGKITSNRADPVTYPRNGIGFGIGAGGISAGLPSNAMTKGTLKPNTTPPTQKQIVSTTKDTPIHSALQVKAANHKGTNMLEKIKALALEKCAGDEEKAKEFLEGFYDQVLTKQADFLSAAGGMVQKPFVEGLAKGLAGLTIGLGALGAVKTMSMAQNNNLHVKFVEAVQRAIQMNSVLRNAKKEKVASYAQTIFNFAPHVATDPNLLSSILASAVQGDGIDPMTISTLTQLEQRYNQNSTPVMIPTIRA